MTRLTDNSKNEVNSTELFVYALSLSQLVQLIVVHFVGLDRSF